MGSKSEVGHIKNVENAKKVTDLIAGLGSYNPTNAALQAANLVAQQGAAAVLQQNVNSQYGIYQTFQNARVNLFTPLKKLRGECAARLKHAELIRNGLVM